MNKKHEKTTQKQHTLSKLLKFYWLPKRQNSIPPKSSLFRTGYLDRGWHNKFTHTHDYTNYVLITFFLFIITASVPGAKEDDYKVDEELNKLIVEESELQQRDEARQLARQAEHGQQMAEESGIGAVSFVSCATGSDSHRKSEDDEDQSQSKFRL